MNYDFKVTIERVLNNAPHGFQMVFKGTEDLEEVFTPKIVSMLLKSWASHLEENQAIIPCPLEKYRSGNRRV